MKYEMKNGNEVVETKNQKHFIKKLSNWNGFSHTKKNMCIFKYDSIEARKKTS